MYEFVGPNPAGLRGEVQMQVSEFFEPIGMFHRNFPWAIGPNSRYRTRYAQVGCSARARARPRAREPPGSEYRMFEYHSCPGTAG